MNSKFFYLLLAFILLQVAYSVSYCELCTYSEDGMDTKGNCTPCDEGTCTLDFGTVGKDQSACQVRKCQAGKFSHTGYDSNGRGEGCNDCSEGTYSLEGSTSCHLITCGYGFYSKTGYFDFDSQDEECHKCPDDKSTSQQNTKGNDDSACDLQLLMCPEGKWSNSGYYREGYDNNCQDCKIGTYSEKGSKYCNLTPCEYGTYSKTGYYDRQKNKCEQCPDGKTTKQTNTKGEDESVCEIETNKCPEGKYSKTGYDLVGNGNGCKNCPKYTHSEEGSKSCYLRSCNFGFYSSTGFYNQQLNTNCRTCPDGKSTQNIQTKGENDSVCTFQLNKCPAGKWSTTGYEDNRIYIQCKDCADGTSSEEGSTKCNKIFCGFGYYSKRGFYYDNEDNDCQQCPEGKSTLNQNTIGEDDSVCQVHAQLCPKDTYSLTGYDYDGEGKGCYKCDYGFYSLKGSKECNLKPCGYGFYSPTGCYAVDQLTECSKCPVGKSTYQNKKIGTDDSACDKQYQLCPAGFYSKTGYHDEYQEDGSCYLCEEGFYSLEGSKECNLQPCGYGFYSPTGYYAVDKLTECDKCPVGKSTEKNNQIGEDESACDYLFELCPAGLYSKTGYHDQDEEQGGCYYCEEGFYSLEGSKECNLKPCGYGFYSQTGYYAVDKLTECEKCPFGKSTQQNNQKGKDDSACDLQGQLCPAGQYSYENSCIDCDHGTHSLEGSTECNLIPCGIGFYSKTGYYDSKTQNSCNPCPNNTTTQGQQTIGFDDSVCLSQNNEVIENRSNNVQDNSTTTSSIIIQITLNLILLLTIF